MDESNNINKIELLKSQSDLESLKKNMDYYVSKVNVAGDSEYEGISDTLNGYLGQVKNGIVIKNDDVVALKNRWKKFMVGHAYTGLWKARLVYPLIVAAFILTPLFYYTTHSKPGYELIVIILVVVYLVYLAVRSKQA